MVIILLIVLVIRPNRIHLIFIIYSYIIILFAIKKDYTCYNYIFKIKIQ